MKAVVKAGLLLDKCDGYSQKNSRCRNASEVEERCRGCVIFSELKVLRKYLDGSLEGRASSKLPYSFEKVESLKEEGYSLTEIAEMFGITTNVLYARMHRERKRRSKTWQTK